MPVVQKILNSPFLFVGFLVKYLFFLRKGYGKLYVNGIKEGLHMGEKSDKVKTELETDLTISVNDTEEMVRDSLAAVEQGFRILKV